MSRGEIRMYFIAHIGYIEATCCLSWDVRPSAGPVLQAFGQDLGSQQGPSILSY
jgi:hypothetical protein